MTAPVAKTPKEFSPSTLAAMQFVAGGCAGNSDSRASECRGLLSDP